MSLGVVDTGALSGCRQELATGWSRVFLIGACVYFFGNTMFVLFGRADVQPWNNPESSATPGKAEKGEKGEKGNPVVT